VVWGCPCLTACGMCLCVVLVPTCVCGCAAVLDALERMEHNLTAAVVSNDVNFRQHVRQAC
jgi:hypothetical protein